MEAKIDKRTNAYKKGVEMAKAEITAKIEENITNPEIVVVESDRIGSQHSVGISYTKDGGLGNPVAVCTDPPTDEPPIPVKADLLHCPGCGTELLEDERNLKGPAYCRKCIWKDA